MGAWIADPDSGMKPQEKANFVHKMMSFEQLRKPTPYTTYLQMIYDLVSNPNPPNPELVSKVQRAWMIGLRCRDPTLRKSFFTFFESQVPKALYSRVQHVIQKQVWIRQTLTLFHLSVAIFHGNCNVNTLLDSYTLRLKYGEQVRLSGARVALVISCHGPDPGCHLSTDTKP